MINRLIDAILVARDEPSEIPVVANLAQSVTDLGDSEIDDLIRCLSDFGDDLQDSDETSATAESTVRMDQILQPIIHHLAVREANLSPDDSSPWSDQRLRSLETLYQLAPAASDLRNHLLRWLGSSRDAAAQELWTELICDDPPEHRLGIVLAFAPLMQPEYVPSKAMLTALSNRATAHSQIAPAVFDLFNYYFRNHRIEKHPAEERTPQLIELLGQLAGQLGRVEEGNIPAKFDARQLNQLVSDSVALIVALCDTFALLKCEAAIPKLHQALQLRHRRVQTEAAAALTRLQDETGVKALIELAEQPVARLRVLAYAEELGFINDISLELQGEIALAESHLAIWLAEPNQMGLAPSDIELIDNREMYWPSYEHPIQCYLFRYSYGKGETAHSNIGICGPLTHAFAADLQHLSIDEIYATFAGWQTVHNEIFQMSPARAKQAFPNDMRRLESALGDEELEDLQIQTVGSFFGELVLAATAHCKGDSGSLIVDSHDSTWFESGNPQAPIDWQMAYAIWRGKQLLAKFNSSESR
jgi:hypothetical protein